MLMSNITFAENNEYVASVDDEYIPTIYSGSAITMGSDSIVYGNIQSVAAATLGEAAELNGSLLAGAAVTLESAGKIIGDIMAGEGATLGATAFVHGDLTAGATVFIGAESKITGDLSSGGGVTLGASAEVDGNTMAGTFLTLGASAKVGDIENESQGNVWAAAGPIVLGERAIVKGNATSASYISLSTTARILEIETQYANPGVFTHQAKSSVATKKDELTARQKALADRLTTIELNTTIAQSTDLYSGVYHASALTTSAGITLTFIGSGYEGAPEEWIINTDTYISFGANLIIDLVDVAQGSTITFNSGSYTTIGANSILRGTFFAGTYITTGENTTITGVFDDCGGMFATNGAITMGARSTFGGPGCRWAGLQDNDSEFCEEFDTCGQYDACEEFETCEQNDACEQCETCED
jgi:serine acetyltransferase